MVKRTYGLEITDFWCKPHHPSVQTTGNFPMGLRQMNFCLSVRGGGALARHRINYHGPVTLSVIHEELVPSYKNHLPGRIKCLLDKKKSLSFQCFTEQDNPRDLLTERG